MILYIVEFCSRVCIVMLSFLTIFSILQYHYTPMIFVFLIAVYIIEHLTRTKESSQKKIFFISNHCFRHKFAYN